jgi:hypothetical protein
LLPRAESPSAGGSLFPVGATATTGLGGCGPRLLAVRLRTVDVVGLTVGFAAEAQDYRVDDEPVRDSDGLGSQRAAPSVSRIWWRNSEYAGLTNPFYAGAYAFGRTETRTTVIDGQPHKIRSHARRESSGSPCSPTTTTPIFPETLTSRFSGSWATMRR